LPKRIDSVKHLLWHGNVAEALDRMADLRLDLELIRAHSAAAEKLTVGLTEFEIYVRNNREFNRNFGERYPQGDTISRAFVESTINQVVSRRFVKKQQMQWTLKGAHLLLQTRTKVLNNELEDVFGLLLPRPAGHASERLNGRRLLFRSWECDERAKGVRLKVGGQAAAFFSIVLRSEVAPQEETADTIVGPEHAGGRRPAPRLRAIAH
jgi:hypothetical protein